MTQPRVQSGSHRQLSHAMVSGQRQHSTISNASTAASAQSSASGTSMQSRLTSKFPVPRIVGLSTRGSKSALAEGTATSSKLLLSCPDSSKLRADIAAQIAHQDAKERKARWTKAKWLLLLSVATVRYFSYQPVICVIDCNSFRCFAQLFSYGLAGLLLALLTWFRSKPVHV